MGEFFKYFSPSIYNYVILSSILFAIGVMGVLIRRNIIIIFMAIELMLNAVNLLLVGFSVHHDDTGGQVFVFFIMAVAAAEITVGLAILMMIYRNTGSVSVDSLKNLKW
ncbi:MAG: NADH-quinone oxidoreductase subunit NuoK [Cytophagaceae bacterium]|nr:NADH-quinone oxidoreductase subunit NuoK [Cytophagaceae bacterium]